VTEGEEDMGRADDIRGKHFLAVKEKGEIR
jgi:hypothetical protein